MLRRILNKFKYFIKFNSKQPSNDSTEVDIVNNDEIINNENESVIIKNKIKRIEKLNLSTKDIKQIINLGVHIIIKPKTYVFYSDKWYRLKNESKLDNHIVSKKQSILLKKRLNEIQINIIYCNKLYAKVEEKWHRLTKEMTFGKNPINAKLIENLEFKLNNDKLNKINFWEEIKLITESSYANKLNEKNKLKKTKTKNEVVLTNIQTADSLEIKKDDIEDIAERSDETVLKEFLNSNSYKKYLIEDYFINKYHKRIKTASYENLSIDTLAQLVTYIWIYKSNHCLEHWEVNEYITRKRYWNDFSLLRSLNDHGYNNKVKGIQPKYFAIICRTLNIKSDDGAPLKDYEPY